ncbi:hypothetical protein [Streptomyces spectabilis]|uniref:Uncharacterized protein n=1 Tax=Streptomyces spectabilis TaxID=68270 RepID=A0A7W8APP6_STRST|nr:hypothetical protein [Streptomyces spectabilis]MBB5102304.1 hypothetical protein [Streptomyces spectabilis]MCI3907352.1 hypothetical protein [Streptomyces spectabilis]GGV30002.1 hypothetical protein GCM10010245_48780 [Streptomyces spectabilis]
MTLPTPLPDSPAAPAGSGPSSDAPRAPWWRRWPALAPRAAALWAVTSAAVQAAWAVSGTGVPLAGERYYPPAALLATAVAGILAAGVSLASTRALTRRGRTVVGVSLVVLIPALGWTVPGVPPTFVTLASGSGVDSVTGLVQLLLTTGSTVLLTAVAVAYRRRLKGRCPRCGQAHAGPNDGPLAHPAPSSAPRRTRATAYALLCGLLPWAGVKTVWLCGGDAIGVRAEAWRREVETESSGAPRALASVGIDVTVLAALLGVFLLLGLLHRWGQVFPRWAPFLSGRRVPRLLPLAPAWLTGAGLACYGTLLTLGAALMAAGVLPSPEPEGVFTTASGLTWMVAFGGLAFAGLGWALLIGARSYAARTGPRCVLAE